MKTYQIKDLLKKEVLIVELPRLCDYHASERKLWIKDTQSGEELTVKGRWDVLGKPDEISEDDAENIVKAPEPYWDDNLTLKVIGNAKWSYVKPLLSAIETVIYWENPLQSTPPTDDLTFYDSKKERKTAFEIWHEAETRTFDRSRTLIFVKN